MPSYKFGNDTLNFDNDNDAISYAEHIGASEFTPIENKPTYKEQAPGLRERVKAVGYSGLSKEDKLLFDLQYPSSQVGKFGSMTLPEVQKFTDQMAKSEEQIVKESNENTGDAYTLARNILSVPVGAAVGTLEYGKDKIFKEGGYEENKPWTEYIQDAMKSGNEGEGLTGLVADPINLGLVVGSGGASVGGQGWIRSGLDLAKGAAKQGIGSGVQYVENTKTPELSDLAKDVGIGSLIGGVGTALLRIPSNMVVGKELQFSKQLSKHSDEVERQMMEKQAQVERMFANDIAPIEDIKMEFIAKGVPYDIADALASDTRLARLSYNNMATEPAKMRFRIADDKLQQLAIDKEKLIEQHKLPLFDTRQLASDIVGRPPLKDAVMRIPGIDRLVSGAFSSIDKSIEPIARHSTKALPYISNLINR